MSVDERLRRMIEAERAVSAPASVGTEGWRRLTHAVTSGAEALTVPLASIPVTTTSLMAEGIAVALVVGTIGATAIVATAPKHSAILVKTARPSAVAIATDQVRETLPTTQGVRPSMGSEAAATAVPAHSQGPDSARPMPRATASALVNPSAPPLSEPDPATASSSTLDEEMQLISQAKRQLDLGKPHLARVWLDEHRSRYPQGTLSAERDGLEVLMACARSNSDAERARALTYASRYPGSPALDRILRSCFRSPASTNSK